MPTSDPRQPSERIGDSFWFSADQRREIKRQNGISALRGN